MTQMHLDAALKRLPGRRQHLSGYCRQSRRSEREVDAGDGVRSGDVDHLGVRRRCRPRKERPAVARQNGALQAVDRGRARDDEVVAGRNVVDAEFAQVVRRPRRGGARRRPLAAQRTRRNQQRADQHAFDGIAVSIEDPSSDRAETAQHDRDPILRLARTKRQRPDRLSDALRIAPGLITRSRSEQRVVARRDIRRLEHTGVVDTNRRRLRPGSIARALQADQHPGEGTAFGIGDTAADCGASRRGLRRLHGDCQQQRANHGVAIRSVIVFLSDSARVTCAASARNRSR